MEEQKKPGTPPPPPEDGTFACPINWIYSLRYDYTGASGAVAEMLEVILQAWNRDFVTMPSDGNLRATARGWKAVVKASLIKQNKDIKQRSDAGKQSAENRRKLKEIADSLTADNQQEPQRASTSVNERQRARPNVNVNLNENNNPPIAPQGARIGGGGNKFSFKEFAKVVRSAEESVPEEITEEIGRAQVVWRYADYGCKYANLIGRLLVGDATDAELKTKIQKINATYPPKTDFPPVSLARAMIAMKNPGAEAACTNEVDAHLEEPGIYAVMLEKVKYIQSGNNVSSYPSFFKARKQS